MGRHIHFNAVVPGRTNRDDQHVHESFGKLERREGGNGGRKKREKGAEGNIKPPCNECDLIA